MKKIRHIISLMLAIIPLWLVAQTPITNKNYVKTSTVKRDGVKIPELVNIGNSHQNVQYIDGIGRPMQVVQIQTTPNQTDLVQVINYDNLGRETVSYLPYAVALGMGDFDTAWQTAQPGYYANPPDDVEASAYPFAVKAWDNSPLNRVMKQGAPGADWQLMEHPIFFDYQSNEADIPLLSWDLDSLTYIDEGYYEAGKLFITQTTDENGSVTKEYKNLSGQVILKTSYLGKEELSTYYIYDDFANLACVIPPDAYKKLLSNGFDSEPEVPVIPPPNPTSTLLDSLISCWEFDETSGTTANDSYGSNNATIYNAAYSASGKLGGCRYFDGSGDYVNTGITANETRFTISMWLKGDGAPDNSTFRVFVNKGGMFTGYWEHSYTTLYNNSVYFHDGTAYRIAKFGTSSGGIWYHYVFTYDGSYLKSYKDGILMTSTSAPNAPTAANVMLIGTYATGSEFFKGFIDQTAYWKRALTSAEVTELYNNGSGIAYPFGVEEEPPPPLIPPQSIYTPQNTFPDQVYTYKYDHRNRVTEKNIPGQKEVYMVYDRLDRLVLTQDAKMRQENKWLFTKYDAFNRPVATGFYRNRTITSQGDMQILVNTELDLFETFNTSTKTYSCVAFPVADSITEWLTYNYYDNYTFIPTTKSYLEYTEPGDTDFGDNAVLQTEKLKGLLTGSKSKILDDGDNYLFTVNYYDDKDRIVQSKTEHAKDGYDISNFLYDFLGNPEMTNLEHKINISGSQITTTLKWWYYYDHASRLADVKHQVNSQTAQWIVRNGYNDLGQLIEKDLHAKNNNDTTLGYQQSVAYSYNIRGWLKKMNSANLTTNDNALFGMELFYNEGLGELGGQATYNGNISGMKWVVNDKTTAPMRAYGFNYDSINRISLANYGDNTGGAFTANNRYSVSGLNGSAIDYDLNGNIQHLWRQGENTGSDNYDFGYIDKLDYSYIGNTLIAVNDEIPDIVNTETIHSDDFKDGTGNDTLEYAYDVNGNMIRDDNKGIINIVYNYLNLPEEINFGGGNKIIYLYSADGSKLKKMVYTNNSLTSTKTYTGSFVYEGSDLEYALFEEGRLLASGGVFEYQYFLKDHLGNTRVTFSGNTGLILQQDHYYPFGMNFAGINTTATSTENFYRYNGKELQKDLDLNWYDYGARFYDPTIARWSVVDPWAEKYKEWSPYNYSVNNPVRFIDPDGNGVFDKILDKAAGAVKRVVRNTIVATGRMLVQSAKSAMKDTRLVAKGDVTVSLGIQAAEQTQIDNKGVVGLEVNGSSLDIASFETESSFSTEGITTKNELDYIGKDGEVEISQAAGFNVLGVSGSLGGDYQLKDGDLNGQLYTQGGVGEGTTKISKDLKTKETTKSTGFSFRAKYALFLGIEINASIMLDRTNREDE